VTRHERLFAREVAAGLSSVLDDCLVGAYFVGSIALGGYVAGESDLDIVAVCGRPLDVSTKRSVAHVVDGTIDSCPARGLEFTLYCSDVVGAAPRDADFEVNVNGGVRMERISRIEPSGQWLSHESAWQRRAGAADGDDQVCRSTCVLWIATRCS